MTVDLDPRLITRPELSIRRLTPTDPGLPPANFVRRKLLFETTQLPILSKIDLPGVVSGNVSVKSSG